MIRATTRGSTVRFTAQAPASGLPILAASSPPSSEFGPRLRAALARSADLQERDALKNVGLAAIPSATAEAICPRVKCACLASLSAHGGADEARGEVVSPMVEGGFVDYAVVAEAYRELEAAGGRLALIDRMAALLGETPDDELATVCYLCQGQIAPEHAGIDLGLASKLAMRSVGVATGKDAEAVTAAFLEAGDLGEAAEAVLPDREPSLTVGEVVQTLHEIARSEGIGSQGRKIDLLAGLLARATPLEARYLLRLVTGSLRLGIGTPTILEEPAAPVPAPRRRTRAPDRLLLPRCGRTSAQRPRASAPSASSMVSASCRLPCRSRPAGSKASRPATTPGRADHAADRSRWVRTSDSNGVHRGE